MGLEIDIESSFWKWYFHNEDDARKIDIFDLINASIAVAAIKKPNEFVSKRLQILESILTADSQAKKGLHLTVKKSSKNNQERVINHDCQDQVCKDDEGEISVGESDKEFAGFLERELDDCEDHVSKNDGGEISVDDRDKEFASFLERELDDCEDHVRKDDGGKISVGESDNEFADFLERELDDEYAELTEFDNVMMASLKPISVRPQLHDSTVRELKGRPQFPVSSVFKHDMECGELRFDKVVKPINVRPKLEEKPQRFLDQRVSKGYTETKYEGGQDKPRKIEVLKRCGGTKLEINKKRKIEEIDGKRAMDSHDLKFEATKTRFDERTQQIEKAKRRVRILDSKEIAQQPRLGRNGKPKQGFGSRMKKIQKSRF
ncbi:Hypothetical predicted protein [Olea europaea subsp. europaea]|uniref:Uncharacterized protein n=1 Tax=Olea europaea subsp. europaea TaxID=158383 RepID=A0A8S0QST2_OLEEU|nr:Hypothetical predicted protein [Olea europaea subsp. europaea]CAA2968691.1 Hypothetical predicted protein [Olea europaea subsp. europaea]